MSVIYFIKTYDLQFMWCNAKKGSLQLLFLARVYVTQEQKHFTFESIIDVSLVTIVVALAFWPKILGGGRDIGMMLLLFYKCSLSSVALSGGIKI